MAKKIFFKNSNNQKICGILEEPEVNKKEIVIIIHGYSSNKDRGSSKEMAEELTKRKINSLRIDLDGCGESEGEFEFQTISSAIDDTEQGIDYVKSLGYKEINLFGSSMGGITAMGVALKRPEIKKMGLKAPVSDWPGQRLRKEGQRYIDEWKEKGYNYWGCMTGKKYKIDYGFFEDSKKYIMYDKVKDIKCPTLIIHGTADNVVLIKDSEKVIQGFSNGKLITLEGADHSLSIDGSTDEGNRLFGDWFEGKIE